MRRPFGLGPRRSDLAPALSVAMIDTSVQVPTSCSLRVFCWLTAPLGSMTSPSAAIADSLKMLRRFMVFLPGLAHARMRAIAHARGTDWPKAAEAVEGCGTYGSSGVFRRAR